jgi:hypothetical protein
MSAVALDDVSGGDVPRPCRRHFIIVLIFHRMGQELLVASTAHSSFVFLRLSSFFCLRRSRCRRRATVA